MGSARGVGSTHIENNIDGTRQRPATLVRRRNCGEALDLNPICAAKMVGDNKDHEEGFHGW